MLTRNVAKPAATQRLPACRVPARRCKLAVCQAARGDEGSQTEPSPAAPAVLKDMQVSVDRFMQRYEHSMLSSGIGAAAVTTWCMVHGQSPGEAAAITVMSTITALVLNEVLFTDPQVPKR